MTSPARPDPADFIRTRLRLASLPGLPELRLFQRHPGSGLGEFLGQFLGENAPAPYWASVWAGGTVLARYLLDHPHVVRGRHVLDLGTGSGLVAIAAALSGAASVQAVDTDPLAITATRLNAAENGVDIEVIAGDLLDGPVPSADLILIGDLFYEAGLAARVTAFLDRCDPVEALIGDPGRASLPYARLAEVWRGEVRDFAGTDAHPACVYCWKR
ncbi:MAG: 50S ribosomal protein L11 methyltransferase [Asticcacaulis sp.]